MTSLAGSYNTATAFGSAINGLLTHPESYRKVLADIDRMKSQGKLSMPVKYFEAQRMPYL